MGENVQCPVCTLYLREGMSLAVHLETHPKEQVIKALVHLTISKVCDSGTTSEESPATSATLVASDQESENKTCKRTEGSTCKSLVTQTDHPQKQQDAHNTPAAGESATGNLNNVSTFATQKSQAQQLTHNDGNEEKTFSSKQHTQAYQHVDAKLGTSMATPATDFTTFSSRNRYLKQQQQPPPPPALSSQQQQFTAETSQLQQQQDIITLQHAAMTAGTNFTANAQHTARSLLPPPSTPSPPPPPPPPPPPLSTTQQQQLHANGQTLEIETLQQHPSHHALLNQQHQMQLHHPQQQQQPSSQQQNVKIIFSPTLPPPPPLQLFSYQTAAHATQHQKPPPAYVTAISQIRSQNKHHQQHAALTAAHQQHAKQNQQQPHYQQQQQQQQQQHFRQSASAQHHMYFQSPTSNSKSQQQSAQSHLQLQQDHEQLKQGLKHQQKRSQSQPPLVSNYKTNDNVTDLQQNVASSSSVVTTTTTITTTTITEIGATSATSRSFSQQQIPTTPTTSGTPTSSIRQTNSPYPMLLTASSPSSSVLRFAESPVATYLERDNGDFIVQETPKHIVECVETDTGEFSVIERIYQSPPSVLHIHDDDEDDADADDVDESNGNDQNDQVLENVEEKQHEQNETIKNSKRHDLVIKNTITPDDDDEEEFMSVRSDSDQDMEDVYINNDDADGDNDDDNGNNVNDDVHDNDDDDEEDNDDDDDDDEDDEDEVENGEGGTNIELKKKKSLTLQAGNTNHKSNNSNMNESENSMSGNFASSSAPATLKKSSKNSITVLSDVQLNLNEYLDLVGNILASSKISGTKPFSASVPIPMVKVEKEEPPDDYESQHTHDDSVKQEETEEFKIVLDTEPTTTTIKPPNTKINNHGNNGNKTDEIMEINISTTSSPNLKSTTTITTTTTTTTTTPTICTTSTTCGASTANTASEEAEDEAEIVDEKPPSIFDATMVTIHGQLEESKNNCGSGTGSSSQVTSVIRMAVTSQQQQQQQQQQQPEISTTPNSRMDEENVAEDLSQPQVKSEYEMEKEIKIEQTSVQKPVIPPPQRKGPKKLIIKPKSTKTVTTQSAKSSILEIVDEQPTTSAAASQGQQVRAAIEPTDTIMVKSEPATIIYDSKAQSILEQHLKWVDKQAEEYEYKTEVAVVQEKSTQFTSLIETQACFKLEENKHASSTEHEEVVAASSDHNVAEDARVLLEFANSKKRHTSAANFLSSTSIFSNAAAKLDNTGSNNRALPTSALRCDDEFIPLAAGEMVISDSFATSQEATDVALHGGSVSSTAATDPSLFQHQQQLQQQQQHQHQQQHEQQQQQTQHQHTFSDYPFSFLYGGGAVAGGGNGQQGNFSPLYHQTNDAGTTAATLASGSNSLATTLEDSSSTHGSRHHQQQHNHQQQLHLQQRFSSTAQWYHQQAVATANADFEAVLAVDCNHVTVSTTDVVGGKYLDLDACKRDSNSLVGNGRLMAPSSTSTSSSFAAATESSLAGGCTADALNIRTDEKMPAKGEISEQESNCDIENSWSQPVRIYSPREFVWIKK